MSFLYKSLFKLQNSRLTSWLTSWLWRKWQHEDTGLIAMVPIWKQLGPRWYPISGKE